jgi:hypothetical protein
VSSNYSWNQNASLIFQNSSRETDFGKRDELHLWSHARLQKCICEFLEGTPFRIFWLEIKGRDTIEGQKQRPYTSKVTHKRAKHLVIINWNFWNLPTIPLLLIPWQGHLFNSQLRSHIDQSWLSDIIASSSGRVTSRCLCFGSSFSRFCNHFSHCEPRFLSFP